MKQYLTFLAVATVFAANADTIPVTTAYFSGPYPIPAPFAVDSVDVNNKHYSPASILDIPVNRQNLKQGRVAELSALPNADSPSIGIVSFNISNTSYSEPRIVLKDFGKHSLYIDNKKTDGKITLTPGTHRVDIKYVLPERASDSTSISIIADNAATLRIGDDKKLYTLNDVLHGRRIGGTTVSPDGKYLITAYYTGLPGGKTTWEWLVSTIDGQPLTRSNESIAWMPLGARYYRTVARPAGRTIEVTDASSGLSSVFAESIPEGSFAISPDERFFIFSKTEKGPEEDKQIYRVIEPEDRQPGWRNRTTLHIYDVATGISRPLTFGAHNTYLLDISDDCSKILVNTVRSHLEKRPTTVFTLTAIDLTTLKADTIAANDGFIGGGAFSPDGTQVLVSGSPEAFNGAGKNVPEGKIPSMTDTQLFIYDLGSRSVKPITRDFNPSISSYDWSRADGNIYFSAEDRDRVSLFSYNPKNSKFTRLPIEQDLVKSFSLPRKGNVIAVTSQSIDNPDRLYIYNSKNTRATLLDEPMADDLADVKFGRTSAWDFINSAGDTICGRFYLPPDFDPGKKYPMIVNYYGGCSPTSRNFESRYPHHAYAAQGYVVYVIQPSGATGFGQEFSSRHVNTAGKDPARDIIEGTKQFCIEHPYVDSKSIGCIGASYGGFMTQYLQTVTDIFAAAISHAGISDHTSYWGEGYWGYSYSEVSMAESYPWSAPDLYVKQSPLYNADKIHTPLLFLHGDADHNVPVGESIQMYTALKLLGRPTAFVAVAGQDHHILDYDKRRKWQDTIFAWFAKYLKDEPEWWDKLYPPTSL